jgi:hypothetical protein
MAGQWTGIETPQGTGHPRFTDKKDNAMFIADDPLLVLIVRFVVDGNEPDASNDEFIRQQLRVLKEYVAGFPEQEQGAKALEWISKHAERYRRNWQRRTVSRRTSLTRCDDCPLNKLDASQHCEIHEQWLYLLQRYIAGDCSSKKYVKKALKMLKHHKKQLKHRGAPGYEQWINPDRFKKTLG